MEKLKKGDYVSLNNVSSNWGVLATTIYQVVEINGSKVQIGQPSFHPSCLKTDYECDVSDIAPIEINNENGLDRVFYLHDRELMMPTRAPFERPKEYREHSVCYLNYNGSFKNGKTILEVIDEAGCRYIHELQRALMNKGIMGEDHLRYELNFNILLQVDHP